MDVKSKVRVGGILLAAGASTRLGQPKQLLEFSGETLIKRAARALISSQCDPVVVVVGAQYDEVIQELQGLAVNLADNTDWQAGMSSSISVGLEALLSLRADIDGVVVALCDQPFVSSRSIDKLINAFGQNPSSIVSASYNDINGVPALFAANMFPELRALTGDKGARSMIRNCRDVTAVDMPEASFDIDTVDDVRRADDFNAVQLQDRI